MTRLVTSEKKIRAPKVRGSRVSLSSTPWQRGEEIRPPLQECGQTGQMGLMVSPVPSIRVFIRAGEERRL